MSFKSKFERLPFTLPGFAVFAFAMAILVRSLAARNAYEIVLSSAAAALLLALWLAGKWAARRLAALEPVWNIPAPMRAASDEQWLIAGPDARIPRFFRLHFRVRGRFFPQGSPEGCPVFAETSMSTGGGASLSVSFPLGGLFRGETSCRLRDMFGFFSFPCGQARERTLKIRNAPCGAMPLRIDAQSGAEDRRNKSANDEERYYMREYSPGDRFRDINWKSSDRINTLITRISPDNQEKITRIEVHFRNYGPVSLQQKRGAKGGPNMSDFWLLDRAKARLAWFLRKVKEEKASYVFHVSSAGASWDLNDDEEIEAFLEDLSAIPFFPTRNEGNALPQAEGETYIFSTACDAALPAFLQAQQGRPFSLFMAQDAPRKKAQGNMETERLLLRDFFSGSFAPLPHWLLPRRERLLNVNGGSVNGGRMMIDYAETRL